MEPKRFWSHSVSLFIVKFKKLVFSATLMAQLSIFSKKVVP